MLRQKSHEIDSKNEIDDQVQQIDLRLAQESKYIINPLNGQLKLQRFYLELISKNYRTSKEQELSSLYNIYKNVRKVELTNCLNSQQTESYAIRILFQQDNLLSPLEKTKKEGLYKRIRSHLHSMRNMHKNKQSPMQLEVKINYYSSVIQWYLRKNISPDCKAIDLSQLIDMYQAMLQPLYKQLFSFENIHSFDNREAFFSALKETFSTISLMMKNTNLLKKRKNQIKLLCQTIIEITKRIDNSFIHGLPAYEYLCRILIGTTPVESTLIETLSKEVLLSFELNISLQDQCESAFYTFTLYYVNTLLLKGEIDVAEERCQFIQYLEKKYDPFNREASNIINIIRKIKLDKSVDKIEKTNLHHLTPLLVLLKNILIIIDEHIQQKALDKLNSMVSLLESSKSYNIIPDALSNVYATLIEQLKLYDNINTKVIFLNVAIVYIKFLKQINDNIKALKICDAVIQTLKSNKDLIVIQRIKVLKKLKKELQELIATMPLVSLEEKTSPLLELSSVDVVEEKEKTSSLISSSTHLVEENEKASYSLTSTSVNLLEEKKSLPIAAQPKTEIGILKQHISSLNTKNIPKMILDEKKYDSQISQVNSLLEFNVVLKSILRDHDFFFSSFNFQQIIQKLSKLTLTAYAYQFYLIACDKNLVDTQVLEAILSVATIKNFSFSVVKEIYVTAVSKKNLSASAISMIIKLAEKNNDFAFAKIVYDDAIEVKLCNQQIHMDIMLAANKTQNYADAIQIYKAIRRPNNNIKRVMMTSLVKSKDKRAEKFYSDQKYDMVFKKSCKADEIDLHTHSYGIAYIGLKNALLEHQKKNKKMPLSIIYGRGLHSKQDSKLSTVATVTHPMKAVTQEVLKDLKDKISRIEYDSLNTGICYVTLKKTTLLQTSFFQRKNVARATSTLPSSVRPTITKTDVK